MHGDVPLDPGPWNPSDLIESLGGDECFARELMAIFIAESPTLLDGIRTALADQSLQTAALAAHALKGAAGNFTTGCAYQLAAELEKVARAGDAAAAMAGFARLEHALAGLLVDMRNVTQISPAVEIR